MLAGIGEVAITPPVGAPLLGCIQRSTGVDDDLFARALVLSDGQTQVAVVCHDLIGMDFTLADEIRGAVKQRTGITTTLLNCSHTHSSPFTIPWSMLGRRWLSGPGAAWRRDLVAKVAGVVNQAAGGLSPAHLSVGRAPAQIGFNRRLPTDQGIVMKPNSQGTVVPWVDVLRVDGADGPPLAVLFSHAAHPVIVHGASRLISADYPGYAAATIRQHFGGKTVAMFGQACGANINGEPLRGGFEEAERLGATLAKAAITAASRSARLCATELKIASRTLALPFQDLPSQKDCETALRQAQDHLAQVCGASEPDDDQLWALQDQVDLSPQPQAESVADDVQPMEGKPWWIQDTILCLRDLLDKIKRGERQSLRFEIQALAFGNEWCLLTMTHELFAEYQLWFDQSAPFERKLVLAYTNGCETYVPTDKEFAVGGYEAASATLDGAALRYPYRVALKPGVEQQIRQAITGLWA